MSMGFLEEAVEFLAKDVGPYANQMDGDPAALETALRGLCARGWMALRRPHEFGGPALSEEAFRSFQEEVARRSGALAFLQTQHQSAVNILVKSSNAQLQQECLPLMGDGRMLTGLGFSQLRRPGPPILRAEECDGGYRVEGHIPWITGFGMFHNFILGAALPDGRAMFGLVSFVPGEEEGLAFSQPMPLAAMQGAQTVTANAEGLDIPHHKVVFVKRPGWIETNDMINITLQGWFALGCARAGLDIAEAAGRRKGTTFILDAAARLEEERQACRLAMAQADDPAEERLKTRAWGIDLAVRCAHAGVAASSGAANSLTHDAQRVYREALVFTVSAQTSAIMEATLHRLVGRGG
jgi:alkylation response protein AidB-like acyl-CoA dehydrogenase